MEGVGARLGRSSTRYGPATVFTGPVRKWKKRWVPLAPHAAGGLSNSHHHHHHSAFSSLSNGSPSHANGNGGGSNGSSSQLLLYKWTPLGPNGSNGNNHDKDTSASGKSEGKNGGNLVDGDGDGTTDEPPRRKFKYMPVCLFEKEDAEVEASGGANEEHQPDEEMATAQTDTSKAEKPDINDVPRDENEGSDSGLRQDLNLCLAEGDSNTITEA